MASTLPRPLARNTHLRSSDRGTPFDPNSPSFNPAGLMRIGNPPFSALGVDMEEHYRPLERLHVLAAHGSGVGYGLGVSASLGGAEIRIEPGIAMDGQGRHIYLAAGGKAEVAPRADVLTEVLVQSDVAAEGLIFPTAGREGTLLVTIQWWETYDSAADTGVSAPKQFRHTPWVRLIKPEERNPDTQVVLARLTLDGQGRVRALDAGGGGGPGREATGVRAQRVQFDGGASVGDMAVGNRNAATIEAAAGALRISVPGITDRVDFVQGSSGVFSRLSISAREIALGAGNDPAMMVEPGQSRLTLGGGGVAGQMRLRDRAGAEALRLDASTGAVAAKRLDPLAGGAVTVGGDLALGGALKPASGQVVKVAGDVELTGALKPSAGTPVTVAGDLSVQGALRGRADQPLGVAGDLKIAGTLLDSRGVALGGNPARKVRMATFTANPGERQTFVIDLEGRRRFMALCVPFFGQPVTSSPETAFAAEIILVDGVATAVAANGGGSFTGISYFTPCVTMTGQVITFRVSAIGRGYYTGAVAIVFYE